MRRMRRPQLTRRQTEVLSWVILTAAVLISVFAPLAVTVGIAAAGSAYLAVLAVRGKMRM